MALLILTSLLLLAQTVTAQAPGLAGVRVTIKRISVADGLPDRQVRSITQDSQGFMWIGTDGGVCRYDGSQFITFASGKDSANISQGSVWTVCGDSNGVLWAGTMNGLNRYDPTTRFIRKYYHSDSDSSSLSNSNIHSIFVDRMGTLWVGTVRGLNEFNRAKNTWARYYPNANDTANPGENYINAIMEDRQGVLWVAAGGTEQINGGGLFMFDRQHHSFIRVGPQLRVYSCYEDRAGDFWAGVEGPALQKVDRSTGRFLPINLPKKDQGSPLLQGVRAFCEDKMGFMWLATSGWGLLRYDKRTKSFTRYSFDPNNPETISSSRLNTVFADREGEVWVGADRGGVNVVSTSPFVHLHTLGSSLPLVSRIDVLFQDRSGLLWVASQGNGVWTYNLATGTSRCILPKGLVRSICQDSEGIIWLVDRFALVRHDPRHNTTKIVWRVPLVRGVRDRIIRMLIDKRNNFWLGGNASLFRVNKEFTMYSVFFSDPNNERTAPINQIQGLAEDRHGKIWVGTNRGVSRFDEKTQGFVTFEHNKNDSTSISSTGFSYVFLDQTHTIWVGTGLGLNRFDDEQANFRRFIPSSPRLPTFVGFPVEDEHGNFWYSSNKRIMKFSPSTGSFQGFDIFDGIEDVEILGWSGARLMSGEILLGTNDGVLVFHPDSIRLSTYVPPVVITGVRKLHQQVVLNRAVELLKEIVLTPRENVFTISFAALSYDAPQQSRYAYQLEGFDRKWVNCGTRREAMYTNLDPGTYIFRVKGSNHDDLWNERGTTLTVIVQPAYWQTWWFKLLVALTFLGLLASIYKREVAHLRKEKLIQQEFSRQQIESQEAERKRLAAELHDGLGQDLLVMNNELQQFIQENEKSREDLKRVASMVQDSIEGVREISANLHPHHLERLGLRAAIEAMVEKVSRSSGLNVRLAGDTVHRMLPKETEIHLYRIIQEALSNVVHHASAKNASVQVKKNIASIEITVSDDGKGFDVNDPLIRRPSHLSGESLRGFGLSSMSERVRIVGGTMKIESTAGSGTMVHVSIPYL